MSDKSWFETGKPIRGGVPLCFPWFGPRHDGRPGPGHGFARLMEWELTTAEQMDDSEVAIDFRLCSNETTRTEWNGDFEVNYQVRIGAALGMELRVRNAARQPMRIEEALHT
jgi:glucose-6-phosphate 1-epimerase